MPWCFRDRTSWPWGLLREAFGDVDDKERVDEEKKDEDDDFVVLGDLEPDNDGELDEAAPAIRCCAPGSEAEVGRR
jgi:hypothetical protein